MPDRATILAATPKCPRGLRDNHGLIAAGRAGEPCGELLRYVSSDDFWSCPAHGNVTTPQSLVHRQTPSVCA